MLPMILTPVSLNYEKLHPSTKKCIEISQIADSYMAVKVNETNKRERENSGKTRKSPAKLHLANNTRQKNKCYQTKFL